MEMSLRNANCLLTFDGSFELSEVHNLEKWSAEMGSKNRHSKERLIRLHERTSKMGTSKSGTRQLL